MINYTWCVDQSTQLQHTGMQSTCMTQCQTVAALVYKFSRVVFMIFIISEVFVDRTICSPSYALARELWMKPLGVGWRTKIVSHYYLRNLPLAQEDESLLEGNSSLSEMLSSVYTNSVSGNSSLQYYAYMYASDSF